MPVTTIVYNSFVRVAATLSRDNSRVASKLSVAGLLQHVRATAAEEPAQVHHSDQALQTFCRRATLDSKRCAKDGGLAVRETIGMADEVSERCKFIHILFHFSRGIFLK